MGKLLSYPLIIWYVCVVTYYCFLLLAAVTGEIVINAKARLTKKQVSFGKGTAELKSYYFIKK